MAGRGTLKTGNLTVFHSGGTGKQLDVGFTINRK